MTEITQNMIDTYKYFDLFDTSFELQCQIKKDKLTKEEIYNLYCNNKDRYTDLLYRDSRLNVTEEEMILAINIKDKLYDIKRLYNDYDNIEKQKKNTELFNDLLKEANVILDKLNEVYRNKNEQI